MQANHANIYILRINISCHLPCTFYRDVRILDRYFAGRERLQKIDPMRPVFYRESGKIKGKMISASYFILRKICLMGERSAAMENGGVCVIGSREQIEACGKMDVTAFL